MDNNTNQPHVPTAFEAGVLDLIEKALDALDQLDEIVDEDDGFQVTLECLREIRGQVMFGEYPFADYDDTNHLPPVGGES
jgi:hypothetical protein